MVRRATVSRGESCLATAGRDDAVITLLLAHAVAAMLAPVLARWLGRGVFWVVAVPPALTAVWALAQTDVAHGETGVVESHAWIPSLGAALSFRTDSLAWLMCLVVGGIGALVLGYCSRYFDADDPSVGRFAGLLTAFAGAMLGLVTSDDMVLLYVFWEITTVLSYLLIGHSAHQRASRAAASQALVVTTIGGLAMLAGIVILGQTYGTYRISELLGAAGLDLAAGGTPTEGVPIAVLWAVILILVGAVSKSALIPFHFWLPGAMAAPTPVSAYLHAAAMVKAGVYLVARFAPPFASLAAWRWTVLVLGGATMLLGAYRALRQHDLKLLLAFGTVSQLGFLILLTGTGTRQAALAGVTMLLAHALYKGSLFLTVGVIDHATGTRDLRELSGLRTTMRWTFVSACLAAASMAGLPPMLGFVGKEAAYAAYGGSGASYAVPVLVVLVTGSALTVAYSARFIWGAFRTQPDRPPTAVHAPGPVLVGIPLLLALGGLVAAPTSTAFEPYLAGYADALPPDGVPVHLGLWHGVNQALVLSIVTLLLGAGLTVIRARVNRWQTKAGRLSGPWGADDLYRIAMHALDRGSLRITGVLQRGSLPFSLGLILLTFLFMVGSALIDAQPSWGASRGFDSSAQVMTAAIIIVATLLASYSRRRLRAVFLVSVAAYGVGLLFLLHGAPDLALTQILAETISLLLLVLVLRRLPSKFTDDTVGNRLGRIAFGVGFGVLVTGLALVLPQVRQRPPASEGLAQSAVEFGGGDNIVNVILVDVRAWDTMGELSVVIVAAIGVASLVFRNPQIADERGGPGTLAQRGGGGDEARWLPRIETLHPQRRSLVLEVIVRLISYPVLVWSLFLLFSGHSLPGGGFAAGLVAGLAFALRYLAGGQAELQEAAPIAPGLLLGSGLFLSAGTGLVSMLVGGDVLQSWIVDFWLPIFGDVHLVTSLFFDIGVYLVVIGLVLDILRSLGVGIDRDEGPGLEDPVYPDEVASRGGTAGAPVRGQPR